MTAQSAIPLKWYVPFATGDSSRVEIPVTSSDATRASQTLGFPPLTMQPPAVGGVPPQGEDFNGAMNQVARVAWWVLNGGGWPYDSTFATNSNINGYPNGATLQSADFLGQWINTVDNNQINPDTVGTNWVPGFQYGATSITGQTGGTTTLTPLQAAKRNITVSGTLTTAQTLIFPTWLKDWSITNNTTGAFTLIVKTAAGSGVTIPQNGSPTLVAGDGTNINQSPQNIASATALTHAATLGQTLGHSQFFTTNGSFTVPSGVTTIYVTGVGGGAGGGGGGGNASTGAAGGGGGGGQGQQTIKQAVTVAPGQVLTVTIGSNGNGNTGGTSAGTTGATGGSGTATTLTGSSPTVSLSLAGGSGGLGGIGATSTGITAPGLGGASGGGGGGGAPGSGGLLSGGTLPGIGGMGGGTLWGSGGVALSVTTGGGGGNAFGYGAGGAGGTGGAASAAAGGTGGNGKPGALLIEW